MLKDMRVTLIHNKPVIANCLSDKKKVYFLSAGDTGSDKKIAEYCFEPANAVIEETKEKFGCTNVFLASGNENCKK